MRNLYQTICTMSINPKELEDWTILVIKNGERKPIKLKKIFYDVSSALNVNRLEWLFKMWNWIIIKKNRDNLELSIDMAPILRRLSITKNEAWQLFQDWKVINIPLPEIIWQKPVEVIGHRTDDEAKKIADLEERIQALEKMVIKLQSNN